MRGERERERERGRDVVVGSAAPRVGMEPRARCVRMREQARVQVVGNADQAACSGRNTWYQHLLRYQERARNTSDADGYQYRALRNCIQKMP